MRMHIFRVKKPSCKILKTKNCVPFEVQYTSKSLYYCCIVLVSGLLTDFTQIISMQIFPGWENASNAATQEDMGSANCFFK